MNLPKSHMTVLSNTLTSTEINMTNFIYLVDYNPPSPPKPKPGKTNVHRYFAYVFEQESELQPNELEELKEDFQERCRFDIDDFRDKLNLKTVAMNMLKTHSWVPKPQNTNNIKLLVVSQMSVVRKKVEHNAVTPSSMDTNRKGPIVS